MAYDDSDVIEEPLLQDRFAVNNSDLDETEPVKLLRPPDKYFFTYAVFNLLGVITLLPWNFFITPIDYWMYKFRDNKNESHHIGNRTVLQKEFLAYLSVSSSLPYTITVILAPFLIYKINLKLRVYGSLFVIQLMFILTTVFVYVNTDYYETRFFILTMTIVVILNVAAALLSCSVFGIIGNFSAKYITSFISGQSVAGIFATITQIVALSLGVSSIHTASIFFITGNVVIFLSIIAYGRVSKGSFFLHHLDSLDLPSNAEEDSTLSYAISKKAIFKKIWKYILTELLLAICTIGVYPAVVALVESEQKSSGNQFYGKYFVIITGYLVFNCGDFIGRILSGYLKKPSKSPNLVLVISVARFVFIPLFLLCNAQPRHHLPVIIHSDALYAVFMVVFAVSNGYFANLPIICSSNAVENQEKELSSTMMAASIGVGMAIGSILNVILIKIM